MRHVAIHEAGHIVAYIRLRIDCGGASIIQNDDSLGRADGEGCAYTQDDAVARVLATCAGYAALVAAGYPEGSAQEGCGSDFEGATEAIDFWQLGSLAEWKQKAIELMARPENIKAVDLIASALVEKGRLDGDHCQVLVELADGEASPEDYQQYLAARQMF